MTHYYPYEGISPEEKRDYQEKMLGGGPMVVFKIPHPKPGKGSLMGLRPGSVARAKIVTTFDDYTYWAFCYESNQFIVLTLSEPP